jgi:hypothetical protein
MNQKSTLIYSTEKSFVRNCYFINDQQLLIRSRDGLGTQTMQNSIFIVFNQVKYLHIPTDFDGIEISVKESTLNDGCTVFSLKCLKTNLSYIVTAGYMNIYENAYLSKYPLDSDEKCWWTKLDNFKHIISYPSDCPGVLFLD